jgi:3-oxoacyl-[acyl-carrier protein] reductase
VPQGWASEYNLQAEIPMKDLKDHVAIITGSSSGVGAATARLLASLGCNVVVNYSTKKEAAESVAEECRQAGVDVLVSGANVASDDDCRAVAQQARDRWGRLDILVNNAGTTKFVDHSNLEGLSAEDFQRIYSVNVIGAYQMTRAANDIMQQQETGGSIVNVASTAAVNGIGSCIAYAASKGAMVTMTLSLARVLAPKVRVNTICPGFIEGDWLRNGMGDERYQAVMQSNRDNAPLGFNATPETVAEAIHHFIVGPQAVTGETLIVDGGRHLNHVPLMRR